MGSPWPIVIIGPTLHDVPGDAVLEFVGIDPIVAAAALLARGEAIDAFVLTVDEGYSAAMAARDISTLSYLGTLHNVIIDAGEIGPDAVELINALFTNDAVSYENGAGELHGAFNRPAPENPPVVWWRFGGKVFRWNAERQLVARN
jgi:alkanesulfonate monooxygenase SsuD/methylene tetrahydromethanopterin reductase-like flavin-dependent oxidoreductase (luciferase family)